MKIAIFAPKFLTHPAHAATHLVIVQRQAKVWAEMGHEIVVLAEAEKHTLNLPKHLTVYPLRGILSSLSHLTSANQRHIPTYSSLFSPDLPFHASRQLKKLEPDLLYSCGTSFSGFATALLGRLTGLTTTHYVVQYTRPWKWWRVHLDTFQGYKVPWKYTISEALKNCVYQPLRLEYLHRWGLKHCTQIIASSQYVKDSLVKIGMDGAKIPVVYPHIDIPEPLAEKRTKFPLITYMGHLWQGRGVLDLVRAFAQVKEHHPEAKLLVAASNVNELTEYYFQKLVAEHNLASSIIRLGVVKDPIRELVMPASVMVFPYRELPSIKLLEALACGRPVITTDVGWVKEFITDGENGFIVKPGDIDGLAYRINNVLASPELAEKIGEKARESLAEKSAFDKNGRAILSIISETCECQNMSSNGKSEIMRT